MIRVMAWVYRFLLVVVYKSPPKSMDSHMLSVSDIQRAELFLLRSVQMITYPEELAFYKKAQGTMPKNLRKGHGDLWRLDPYVDADGILRVGGRLRNALYPDAEKHPVILPKNSKIVQ